METELLSEARRCLDSLDVTKALSLCRDAVAHSPADADAHTETISAADAASS